MVEGRECVVEGRGLSMTVPKGEKEDCVREEGITV